MTELNQKSFKILFHLLSLADFEVIVLENRKSKHYSHEEVLKISDYWQPVIGCYKFLVESNDERFKNLEKAFVKLNFELKLKIIDDNRNFQFGKFLKDNEVLRFINNPSLSNWKFFALTFKNNISEFDWKIKIEGLFS